MLEGQAKDRVTLCAAAGQDVLVGHATCILIQIYERWALGWISVSSLLTPSMLLSLLLWRL